MHIVFSVVDIGRFAYMLQRSISALYACAHLGYKFSSGSALIAMVGTYMTVEA